MQEFETPLALAKKLISLPSYVSETQDETPATDFLADYIQANLPGLTVERQYLEAGSKRCNLIVRGRDEPKLFVLGHIDTVQPKSRWATDPFEPVIRDGKLYGLGAADMKSSLAAFVWALVENKRNLALDNLLLLIYVDEEYDFRGIMRYVADEEITKLTPTMTLSLDGDLAVATGCRGVIELNLEVSSKSGHASNPKNGINAVTETVLALQSVSEELGGFVDTGLGATTTNIAYLRGGVVQQDENGETTWPREGNIIPDTAEVTFEVRTPLTEVNAQSVLNMIESNLKQRGLTLKQATVRHDIKPWPVVYDEASLALLKGIYAQANVPFELSDRALQGYIDAQMVADRIQAPTFIIGTGGDNKHGANENVLVEAIEDASRIYSQVLRKLLDS
jgi:succinyl-diaminopimelate desuccinylase